MDTQQPQQGKQPSDEVDVRLARAKDTLQTYGIAVVMLTWWVIWCVKDGWFNPGYKYIGFSRTMAYISIPILCFCVVMAGSAGLTVLRNRKQQPPTPPSPPLA